MAVDYMEILAYATKNEDGYLDDILGLARKAFPPCEFHEKTGKELIVKFILKHQNMWYNGNQDPVIQKPVFRDRGIQPLWLDERHNQRNPNITARDYLFTFKEYMRRLASKFRGFDKENWERMQRDVLVPIIKREIIKSIESSMIQEI